MIIFIFSSVVILYGEEREDFPFEMIYPSAHGMEHYWAANWHSDISYIDWSKSDSHIMNEISAQWYKEWDGLHLLIQLQGVADRGRLVLEGYDLVFQNSSREIIYDSSKFNFQVEANNQWFHGWYIGGYEKPLGGIELWAPLPAAFKIEVTTRQEPMRSIALDFFDRYYLEISPIHEHSAVSLNWTKQSLNLELGLEWNSISTSSDYDLPREEIRLGLDIKSTYSFLLTGNYELRDGMNLYCQYQDAKYQSRISSGIDGSRYLDVFSDTDGEHYIESIYRYSSLGVAWPQDQVSLQFYQLILPAQEGNRSYIDLTPMSPLGSFYRRRDFYEDFHGNFILGNLSYSGERHLSPWTFSWDIMSGGLYWESSGSYHYVDGFYNPINSIWNFNQYPSIELHQSGWLFYMHAQGEVEIKMGRFFTQMNVSQWIPLSPLENLFDMNDLNIESNPSPSSNPDPNPTPSPSSDELKGSSPWAGLDFGIKLGMEL